MNKLTYFIAKSSMFGIGFFLIFQQGGKDSWIPIIFGTMLGILILYLYNSIKKNLNNEKIEDVLKKKTLGKLYNFILIIFYLYLMTIILMLLPLFVNSFYLTSTPKIIINIPFILLALYLTKKKQHVLEDLSNLLCIISVALILFFAIFLAKYTDINYILPIFTNKTTTIIKLSIIYALITTVPQIITVNYNNDFKTTIKDYLLVSLSIFIIIFFTVIALGEPMIKIFSFPEYTVLRQIKLFNFIENIENISAFIWYFDMFIMLSTLLRNLKSSLPKKYNLIYFYSLSIIVLLISSFIIGGNYQYILHIVYSYPYILAIFLIIFITLLIYLKRNKNITKNQ